MKINIFGSTGIIGSKTLDIINNYFPSIKINLLVANNNYQSILNQIKKYKPNYVYLNNQKYNKKLFNQLKKFEFGVLPEALELTLSLGGTHGIIGNNILINFDFVIDNLQNKIFIKKELPNYKI